jgi:hypothetical protein
MEFGVVLKKATKYRLYAKKIRAHATIVNLFFYSFCFALGVILKRPLSPWKYCCFNWVGVQKIRQKSSVGKRLYNEQEKRFKQEGARIAIVDVESNNPAGIRFVKGLGSNMLKVTSGSPRTSKNSQGRQGFLRASC